MVVLKGAPVDDGGSVVYSSSKVDCIVDYHAEIQSLGKSCTLIAETQIQPMLGTLKGMEEDIDVAATVATT
jgi:hypothetical protein